MKKYPRSQAIQDSKYVDEPSCVMWDGRTTAVATKAMAGAMTEYNGIQRTKGTYNMNLSQILPGISGRPGFNAQDYYAFRPGERPPSQHKEIISRCDLAYQTVGLIRNIIDLMADFACQGVRLVHPNKRIEKFFQNWFIRVGGKERSERFLNNLYRTGNVVVRKQTAKLKASDRDSLYKSSATPDMKVEQLSVIPNEIPWKYIFLDPINIEVVGGPLSSFVGTPRYAIKLPYSLKRAINTPKDSMEVELVNQLPKDIISAAASGKPYLLPSDKTSVYFYKKDDWQQWANPMIFAILRDIDVLEKLKLADMAALDGAISNIRIFKLGSLEYKIAPTRAAASKLASILENNVGGGTMDLVWGPDIELIESKTTVHQFLGDTKYIPHLNAIFGGLGIPPTLTGMSGAGGTTNNYISLKTLMQRLQYGRDVLEDFWTNEIVAVQKAMGFRFPAKVEFDINILGDEDAEKSLLIQLSDRSLISDEYLQYRFSHDPEMEKVRLNREEKDRQEGKMIPKASPYHDPQVGIALKKIALQTGIVSPGQVGLTPDSPQEDMVLYEPNKGEKPALKLKQAATKPAPGQPSSGPAKPPGTTHNISLPIKIGQPQQGRPKNSKDKSKRATKTFKPKSKAATELWIKAAQAVIAEKINEAYLTSVGKKNMRSLSNEEVDKIETIKFDILFHIVPGDNIDDNTIMDTISLGSVDKSIHTTYNQWTSAIAEELERPLTLDEKRQIQISLYTEYYIGDE